MTARIILGVSGGIAAYKACSLLRLLRESGHQVRVIPTASALRFVGAPTWEALAGHPVHSDVWHEVDKVPHVSLGRWADLLIVAPASANLLARAAAGMSDDLLTASLLTASCPVLMAPAMHTEMWEHPATVANVATLRARGVQIIEPAAGRLTGSDSGPGRLPEPADLADTVEAALSGRPGPVPPGRGLLAGRRVVVSAGGTREPLDPVRFLGNRSSGRQGLAVAAAARAMGASVTVIAAHVEVATPPDVQVVPVSTAHEMLAEMTRAAADADIVIMAAAVADFRPAVARDSKIKKVDDVDPDPIALVRNPDILATLARQRRAGQVLVGFAAETIEDPRQLVEVARAKMRRKGCDLIVANDVGADRVFGRDTTEAVILAADGTVETRVSGSKADLAARLLEIAATRLP